MVPGKPAQKQPCKKVYQKPTLTTYGKGKDLTTAGPATLEMLRRGRANRKPICRQYAGDEEAAMPSKTSNEFIVKLEGLNLSPAAARAIAGNIQSVVLRELAAIDTGGDIRAHIPRKEWIGIWLARARAADLGDKVLQVQELKNK